MRYLARGAAYAVLVIITPYTLLCATAFVAVMLDRVITWMR